MSLFFFFLPCFKIPLDCRESIRRIGNHDACRFHGLSRFLVSCVWFSELSISSLGGNDIGMVLILVMVSGSCIDLYTRILSAWIQHAVFGIKTLPITPNSQRSTKNWFWSLKMLLLYSLACKPGWREPPLRQR